MEFQIDTKHFTGVISSIVNIFQGSAMLAASGNELLLTAEGKTLTIESANAGMYVKATMAATVGAKGDVLINSSYIQGLRLMAKQITFKQAKAGSRIIFECGKFAGQFDPSQNVAKIAEQRPKAIATEVILPQEPFKKGMKLVMFTPNKTTPVLPLHIICTKKSLTLSTYDLNSCTYFQTTAKDLVELDTMAPAAFIASAFDKLNGKIEFGMSEKQIKLSSDYFEIYHPTKQNFQKFDVVKYYESLQKVTPSLVFKCKAMAWLEALQTTASLTSGMGVRDNSVKVSIDPKNKVASVDLNASIGEASSEFEITSVSKSDSKTFPISSATFNEFLGNLGENEVTVSLYAEPNFKRVVVETDEVSYLLPMSQG